MKVKILMTMPNMYEQQGRLYSVGGGICTLSARDFKDAKRILIRRITNDKQSNQTSNESQKGIQ